MMTKSRTFAERIVGHPLWTGVADALLTSTLHWNWVSGCSRGLRPVVEAHIYRSVTRTSRLCLVRN